jgi:putative hydrolase of the HAD superfamily
MVSIPAPIWTRCTTSTCRRCAPTPTGRTGSARRIVYTNGCEPYARRVLAARGLGDVFDAVYGVEHAGFRPKPERAAFEAVFARDGIAPERGAMFEDDPRNLAAPHALGMRTVLVGPEPHPGEHIHHHASDLAAFLSQIG